MTKPSLAVPASTPASRANSAGALLAINQARMECLASLGLELADRSVIDMECGLGDMTRFFQERGCQVTGIETHFADADSVSLARYGRFDIVFSYGLLEHLENPVTALRYMAEICDDLLLLETIVTDCAEPVLRLNAEPDETRGQAMPGCHPSPAFLVRTLSRLGFWFLYSPANPPAHPDFLFDWQNNLESFRDGHPLRCTFVASRRELKNSNLVLLYQSPAATERDRNALVEEARQLAYLRPIGVYPGWSFAADWENPDPQFAARRALWEEFNRRRLEVPVEFTWYEGLQLDLYLGNDLSRLLFVGGCADPNEFAFLDRLLKPGMVVVDAGANDGLYTLFASRRVGDAGRVLAFEPSAREFARLERNIARNGLENVRTTRAALSNYDGQAQLHIAGYEHEGQNTLGGFAYAGVDEAGSETVAIHRLDTAIEESGVARLDVLKLDVEGGEIRLLEGARTVLQQHRPVILFEAHDGALRNQGGSRDQLLWFVRSLGYRLYAFGASGQPIALDRGTPSDNMIATPLERPLPDEWCECSAEEQRLPRAADFRPALAYWNQRFALAACRDRILALSEAVDRPADGTLYQVGQLMSAAIDFRPDLILEIGRGAGNFTSAFTEASYLCGGSMRIVSVCSSNHWHVATLPRLHGVVSDDWLKPLEAIEADIVSFDYEKVLAEARRVIVFWDANGFDVAECVLGGILPQIASTEHLIFMHDLSDSRYSQGFMEYGSHGLWKGRNDGTGSRVKLGIVDSAVEQSVAVLDFAARNRLTLESADHSIHTDLSEEQRSELKQLLGNLYDAQGHWFYFTLNQHQGPYVFPCFQKPSQELESSNEN